MDQLGLGLGLANHMDGAVCGRLEIGEFLFDTYVSRSLTPKTRQSCIGPTTAQVILFPQRGFFPLHDPAPCPYR